MLRVWAVAAIVALCACNKADGKEFTEAKKAADRAPWSDNPKPLPEPEKPPPPPKPFLEKPMTEALESLRDERFDSVNRFSGPQMKLMLWARRNLRWQDVDVDEDETTAAHVMKDSEPHIGKRMCIKGRITQINATFVNDEKMFQGVMVIRKQPITFIAVASTGDLVARNRARFCGLIAGRYDYTNTRNTQSQGFMLVGMFDLPENRTGQRVEAGTE